VHPLGVMSDGGLVVRLVTSDLQGREQRMAQPDLNLAAAASATQHGVYSGVDSSDSRR